MGVVSNNLKLVLLAVKHLKRIGGQCDEHVCLSLVIGSFCFLIR